MKNILCLVLSFILCPLAMGANQTLSTRLNVGPANTYNPGVTSGIVPAAGLPANTLAAPSSGNVNYYQESKALGAVSLTSSTLNFTSITLTPGTYILYGQMGVNGTNSTTVNMSITSTSNGVGTLGDTLANGNISAGGVLSLSLVYKVTVTGSNQTWYLTGSSTTTQVSGNWGYKFAAVLQ